MTTRGRARIGCSGFNYRDWRGLVYPPELPSSRWLPCYATRFDTVELNNTFYRLPTKSAVQGWASAVPEGFDPKDRAAAMAYLQERHAAGEVVTGLVYADDSVPDLHELSKTPDVPLSAVPFDRLCPGSDKLAELQAGFR